MRPCLQIINGNRASLTNVDLQNCKAEQSGAGLYLYNTTVRYNGGAVTNTLTTPVIRSATDFPGAGGAIASFGYGIRGALMNLQVSSCRKAAWGWGWRGGLGCRGRRA